MQPIETMTAAQLLEDLSDVSEQLVSGDVAGLRAVRRRVGDVDLPSVFEGSEESALGVIYILKRLINDIWANLGTDASFSMARVQAPVGLAQQVERLATHLGWFIKLCQCRGMESRRSALVHLMEAVGIYYSIVVLLERRAESQETIDGV